MTLAEKSLPAAIIGAGGRAGNYYLFGLEKIGAKVFAYDIHKGRMDAAAKLHSNLDLTIVGTMEEAFEQSQIAYIVTPDHVRKGVADNALRAPNIQLVVIEKPLADNLLEAKEIHKCAMEEGKKVIVGSTYRATSVFSAIKQLVQDGELGKIIEVYGTYHHDMRLINDDWRRRGKGQNGYQGAAIHVVDTIIDLLGEPVREISAMDSRLGVVEGTDGYNRPELIEIMLRFASGTLAHISVNLATPLPPGKHGMDLIVSGSNGEYRAHNKGLPEKKSPGEFIVFKSGNKTWESQNVTPFLTIDELVKIADAWARGSINTPYPFATIDQALYLTYVLDLAERSAKTHQYETVSEAEYVIFRP